LLLVLAGLLLFWSVRLVNDEINRYWWDHHGVPAYAFVQAFHPAATNGGANHADVLIPGIGTTTVAVGSTDHSDGSLLLIRYLPNDIGRAIASTDGVAPRVHPAAWVLGLLLFLNLIFAGVLLVRWRRSRRTGSATLAQTQPGPPQHTGLYGTVVKWIVIAALVWFAVAAIDYGLRPGLTRHEGLLQERVVKDTSSDSGPSYMRGLNILVGSTEYFAQSADLFYATAPDELPALASVEIDSQGYLRAVDFRGTWYRLGSSMGDGFGVGLTALTIAGLMAWAMIRRLVRPTPKRSTLRRSSSMKSTLRTRREVSLARHRSQFWPSPTGRAPRRITDQDRRVIARRRAMRSSGVRPPQTP
jgi:hypothetical protein